MENTANDTVEIETTIAAPVQTVWAAWTHPALIMQWFGSDPGGTVQKAELDVKAGGSFEITFSNTDGTEFTCFGTYKQVQPYSNLSFDWAWKNEPGVTSIVTITLTPVNNSTLMHFRHAKVGTASAHNYSKGWQDTFLKLEKVVGGA